MVAVRGVLLSKFAFQILWQLRAEAKVVDGVAEGVSLLEVRRVPVVGEIVDMHVAVAVTAARRNMKVANNLVDSDTTLNSTSFPALLVKPLTVVLALALLDRVSLLAPKLPCCSGVCVPHFVTGVAAACFCCIRRRSGAITFTTV